jgi:hypothetical protein
MNDCRTEEMKKLYSSKAIAIATYFGGPLAAGVLMRRNFINLGKDDYARQSLMISIIATLLMFVGLLSIPEQMIDKIPRYVIPAVYTAIVYWIVYRLQGADLEKHRKINGLFYSGWKAAGVGVACLAVLLAGLVFYVLLAPDESDNAKFDARIQEIQKNEKEAYELFALLENGTIEQADAFINQVGIPAWQKNLLILDELDRMEGLSAEFKEKSQFLQEYCKLQIESFSLIGKAIMEDTDSYDLQMEQISKKIDALLKKL